jgi:hypothetical protein
MRENPSFLRERVTDIRTRTVKNDKVVTIPYIFENKLTFGTL